MGIELRPKGEAKAAATAGTIIGQAQKAAEQWELQKAVMRSQQAFQQELRLRQVQLDAKARAMEWELEKMELASRLDFQQKERARQMEMSKYQTLADTLQKEIDKGTTEPTNPQIQERLAFYKAKAAGVDAPASLYNVPSSQMKPKNIETEARKFLVNTYGTMEAGTMSLADGLLQAQKDGYDISKFKSLIPDQGVGDNILDEATARQILKEAGGNKELARQIARQRGYSL